MVLYIKIQEPVSDSVLDALVDTLGMPEPEPEEDLTSIVEVQEVNAKSYATVPFPPIANSLLRTVSL